MNLATVHHDDIFLQPHADDVCFSLGMFAWIRRKGILLTVYPLSKYCFNSALRKRKSLRDVTELRLAEDTAFAQRCGLQLVTLAFADAGARGEESFGLSRDEHITAIEKVLLNALRGPTLGRSAACKSWLFCPAGIGRHVDHVGVLRTVVKHLEHLEQHYRIAFYEDLHYASDPKKRRQGLAALHELLHGRQLRRYHLPLDAKAQARKMQLVKGYDSQLAPQQRSIVAFTPAIASAPGEASKAHEAVWLLLSSDTSDRDIVPALPGAGESARNHPFG